MDQYLLKGVDTDEKKYRKWESARRPRTDMTPAL